jgi:alpha-1,3/alpha-1,6-mannosyltransferase
MKIALIMFDTKGFGGGNKFASELASGLKNAGIDVAICAWNLPTKGASHEELLEIDQWFIPRFKFNIGKLYKITFNLSQAVKNCIKSFKPTIVINTTTEPSIFHNIPMNIKKIHFVHYPTELTAYKHTLKHEIYRSVYWWIHYKTIPQMDRIVCNSNYTRELTYLIWQNSEPNKAKYQTIYPSVDTEKFDKSLEREKKVCYVGRIDKYKGIDTVINAFTQIKDKVPDAKLEITGGVKGSIWAEEYLPELSNRLQQISDVNVQLKTDVPSEELYETLLTSRCMASFNPFEHYGIVPIEAMAAGTPPIVANGGGQKETIINEETGFLVNDVDEMAEKMYLLLTDEKTFNNMSKKAREHARKFDKKQFIEGWLNLIEKL